jgi:hypothetical protein
VLLFKLFIFLTMPFLFFGKKKDKEKDTKKEKKKKKDGGSKDKDNKKSSPVAVASNAAPTHTVPIAASPQPPQSATKEVQINKDIKVQPIATDHAAKPGIQSTTTSVSQSLEPKDQPKNVPRKTDKQDLHNADEMPDEKQLNALFEQLLVYLTILILIAVG